MRQPLQGMMFDSSSQQATASLGSEKLREAAIETRQQTQFQQLESAFSHALNNNYIEFTELLEQSDNGRPLLSRNKSAADSTLFADHIKEDAACLQALGELNQRLSVLTGMKVNTARNPFSPDAFALAFEQSLMSLRWIQSTQHATAKLFATDFVTELPELYKEMNHTLADGGILPELAAANDALDVKEMTAAEETADQETEIDQIHAPGPQPSGMPSRVLTQLPANDFSAAESAAEGGANKQAVRNVHAAKTIALELVGEVINQLLSYDEVSLRLKNLLSRLYTPYSELARTDSRFPDDPDHPGHHLLQSVERAVELFQTDALVLQRPELVILLNDFVTQLTQQALTGRNVYVLAFKINSQLRAMERRIEARRVREKPALNGLDKITGVQSSIRKQISERLQQAEARIPARIEDFLIHTWTCYVSSLYVNPTADRDQTERTLAMADRIICYAGGRQPMTGDQYTVIAIAVRQAMTRCGATGTEIESFLTDLKHAHAHPLADIVIGSHETDENNKGVAKA